MTVTLFQGSSGHHWLGLSLPVHMPKHTGHPEHVGTVPSLWFLLMPTVLRPKATQTPSLAPETLSKVFLKTFPHVEVPGADDSFRCYLSLKSYK